MACAAEPELRVQLGERFAGLVSPGDVERCRTAMIDAAQRDEHACVPARLTRRKLEPHYLLEIAVPPENQQNQ